mgnify:CR=1 FL=1
MPAISRYSMYLGVPVDPVMEADLTGKGWTLQEVVNAEQAKVEQARAENDTSPSASPSVSGSASPPIWR